MKKKTLKQRYEQLCNEYIAVFCAKNDIEFEFWVADDVGGIVLISDYYFGFDEIRLDIDNDLPDRVIFDWYNDRLENKTEYNLKSYYSLNREKYGKS